MPIPFLEKFTGIQGLLFQLGLTGPQLKNNSGAVEARNNADNAFAIARAATPVGDDDLTTKRYVDQLNKPVVAAQQFDGNNALPANSGTEQFYVVTTTGANATIGQLLWDDGTGVGTTVVVPALDGRSIFTAQAFNGGTITLEARAYYTWSVALGQWQIESTPEIGGAVREIRLLIGFASATYTSASKIPANAQVVECQVEIETAFSGGTTITVGRTGSLALVQGTTDNLPSLAVVAPANIFAVQQDTAWGGAALPVVVTIGGGPGAGAGHVIVRYTEPNL